LLLKVDPTDAHQTLKVATIPDVLFSYGIAFDGLGKAYITANAGRIYTYDTASPSTSPEIWNTGTEKPAVGACATSVYFWWPNGIVFDAAGNMLLSDEWQHCVWLVNKDFKKLQLVAGTGSPGSHVEPGDPSNSRMNGTAGVAFGPQDALVYTA
jgi:sugar lactone lactonase YvrE